MFDLLSAYCSAHPWLSEPIRWFGAAGALPILFLAGLLGSFTHCAGMCGPFVLAQVGLDKGRGPLSEPRRLARALLLPYHLGRSTTYVALGAAGGGTTGLAVALGGVRWLPGTLLGLAALVFLYHGLSAITRRFSLPVPKFANPLSGLIVRTSGPLLANPNGWRGYALGIVLGFLPCGLLWSALTAAAGSGTALNGALGMGAFAIGTMPSLILVAYVGVFFRNRALPAMRALNVPLMLGNAGLLGYFAIRAFA